MTLVNHLKPLGKRALARRGISTRWLPPVLAQRLARAPQARLHIELDHVIAHRMLSSPDFFFVQIGACDGQTDDPIYEHVRRRGWRGVLVEPHPHSFSRLQHTYRDVPGLTLRNVAISERHEKRLLYTANADAGSVFDSFNRSVMPGSEHAITVDCITVDELLSEAASDHIDLIQIDVEGYDAEIIRQLDLDRWKPAIIHFEHALLSNADYSAALDKLVAHGYQLTATWGDTLAYKN